jgi:hypothetical protein
MSQDTILKEGDTVEKLQEERRGEEINLEEALNSLDRIREETGQISELTMEQERLSTEFLRNLSQVMRLLSKSLAVSTSILPREWGDIRHANLDLTGQLLILHEDGKIESKNLREEGNHEVLVKIINDIMPKLQKLAASHRQKIEKRVGFMSAIVKEFQKIAKSFTSNDKSSTADFDTT